MGLEGCQLQCTVTWYPFINMPFTLCGKVKESDSAQTV